MHRVAKWSSIGCLLVAAHGAYAADAGSGFSANRTAPNSERWQARLSFNTSTPWWRGDLARTDVGGLKVQGLGVMGDYYFTRNTLGVHGSGGFRATSGLLLGSAMRLWAGQPIASAGGLSLARRDSSLTPGMPGMEPEINTVPYAGFGYTGLSAKGGWGFSADVGLMALSPGSAVRFGRASSGQSLDDMVRDVRLAPVLQLGVSYSF